MIEHLIVYKEGTHWFFDDKEKKIQHEEFVAGVPKIFEFYAGKIATRIRIDFSDEPFPRSLKFDRIHEGLLWSAFEKLGTSFGVRYQAPSGQVGWLCPVFWKYFKKAPDCLYVKIERIS